MYANALIPHETKSDIITTIGVPNLQKASKLMDVLEKQLQASRNKCEYLVNICTVLRVEEDQNLREIANSILKLLGK